MNVKLTITNNYRIMGICPNLIFSKLFLSNPQCNISKLGFKKAIIPKANMPKGASFENMEIHAVERIEAAFNLVKDF